VDCRTCSPYLRHRASGSLRGGPASGVVTRDKWAIELDEIEGTVTRVSNGMDISSHVKTVVVYRREADGEWKVARLMELLD